MSRKLKMKNEYDVRKENEGNVDTDKYTPSTLLRSIIREPLLVRMLKGEESPSSQTYSTQQ